MPFPNPFTSLSFRIKVLRYPAMSRWTSSQTLLKTRLLARAVFADGGADVNGVVPVYSACNACARVYDVRRASESPCISGINGTYPLDVVCY